MSTFEPRIVKKRQRRLTDVDEIVLLLYAKGMTAGEVSAHFAEVYGASVANRPLDAVYPAVFIDAIMRHEAPCDRVEVEDLHRLAVAAVGLELRAA